MDLTTIYAQILAIEVLGIPVGSFVAKLIGVVFIFLGAKIATRFTKTIKLIDDKIDSIDLAEHTHHLIEKALNYSIWFVALLLIMNVLGLTSALQAMLAGAGIVGIAVGFAAKDVLSNLLSGVFLQIDRPFKIGDTVKVGDMLGKVKDINLRTTDIKTFDGIGITIPNSKLATSTIVNYSRYKVRRMNILVGVAYEADIGKVDNVIGKVLEKDESVLDAPEAQIIIKELGDFAINLEVRAHIDTRKSSYSKVKSELTKKIKVALDKAGIEIPYPKRVNIQKK